MAIYVTIPAASERNAFAGALPLNSVNSRPSIFVVPEDELGVKIESARGPAAMLAVDRVGKPSEN